MAGKGNGKGRELHLTLPYSTETIRKVLSNGYNYKDVIKFAIDLVTEEMLVALVDGIENQKRTHGNV